MEGESPYLFPRRGKSHPPGPAGTHRRPFLASATAVVAPATGAEAPLVFRHVQVRAASDKCE